LPRLPRRLTRRLSLRSRSLHSANAGRDQTPRTQSRPATAPFHSLPLQETAETGDLPGQRITSPGYGNARKLAGLRCGPVMRWPPMSACPPRKTLPRPSTHPRRPRQAIARTARQRDPRAPRQDAGHVLHRANACHLPRLRESGQLLLRLRCSFLRVWAYAELPALTPPPSQSDLWPSMLRARPDGSPLHP